MKSFSAELPQVGDSDDGHALSRFTRIPSGSINVPNPAVFNDSGYSVVPIATRPSTGFVLDHGPLGMPPSFGHGHADALSLLLWIGGQEIFIDPGTCTYTRNPELRKYFRGTRAHNTVTVDNRDQAIHESTFIWSHQYGTRLIAADLSEQASGKMLAQHDGYDRIGVRHVRGVGWSCDRWLLIWDHLSGEGNHELVLHWHLGIPPSWVDAERLLLDIDGDQLTVHCSGGSISTVYGEDTPTLGWRSRGYGTREPAPTVRARYIGSLPHTFTTLVTFPSIELMAHDIDDMVQWFRDQVQ